MKGENRMTYNGLLFVCRAIIVAVFAVVFVRQNLPGLHMLPIPVHQTGGRVSSLPQTFSVVTNDGRYFRFNVEGGKCFLTVYPPGFSTQRLKEKDGRYYLPGGIRSEAQARAWLAQKERTDEIRRLPS